MTTTVYIETFGCQMNVADSERAATGLTKAGYELTDSLAAADVVLLNTCSVRERAAHKVYTRIGEIRTAGYDRKPRIGVMGCVAQLEGKSVLDNASGVDMVIGTQATDRIPTIIQRVQNGEHRIVDLGQRGDGEIWDVSPVQRHSRYVAFVPIIEGCNKFCSFCIVPYSRGREKSRLASQITNEIRHLRKEGYKEVHLIGQNVNSYRPRSDEGLEGFSGATPFSRLLRAVAATGIERVKFTTSFPRDFHPDIVSAIEEFPNLCDWIHLPVQSGSDRILKAMRRGYTAGDYLRKVERIKSSRRNLSLTSDVIVGFPGETDADFQETVRLVEQCEYDSLYIFKYSRRPGTPAGQMSDDVPESQKTERFLQLETTQRENQKRRLASYVGRTVEVLVEGQSARSEVDLVGHTSCHKVINFPGNDSLTGKIVPVMVTRAKPNSLYGKIARESVGV
jgi:tRNA-2-methylthio-N6-dimethylallyladenosine synthase